MMRLKTTLTFFYLVLGICFSCPGYAKGTDSSSNLSDNNSAQSKPNLSKKPKSAETDQVVVTKVEHFGNTSWKITAAGGTWYFENGETEGKTGFSSAIDAAGNDWIGNDADQGYLPASNYGRHEWRGWPNFGEGNFDHPQRPSGSSTHWVDLEGNVIEFTGQLAGDHLIMRSLNDQYELEYHFFPSHAAIRIIRAEDKYAFLYEGPIGGEQETQPGKDYYVLKDGIQRVLKDESRGFIDPDEFDHRFPSPFFYLADSDPDDTQVFYVGVKNNGPETAGDEGWLQGTNMVIFSFGRDGRKRGYEGTDAIAVFGFHEKNDHSVISNFIEGRLDSPFEALPE